MNTNNYSKNTILEHTTQENIFLHFLNLTTFPTGNVSSPFTKDENASFKLYKNGSFKCNSSTKQGDVWQFVAYLNNLDCTTQFVEVLQIVAKEMNIEYLISSNSTTAKTKSLQPNPTKIATHLQKSTTNIATVQNTSQNSNFSITEVQPKKAQTPVNTKTTTIEMQLQQSNTKISTTGETIIDTVATENEPRKLTVATREYTTLDLDYWNKLGVDKTILEKYKVHSISNYCWTGKKPIYTKNESVAFAFELDGNFKLYIPNQPEIGIKKNVLPPFPKTSIFGLVQLSTEKTDNIIICEGEKDTIVANSRGFNTVTFGSGSIHSKQENIKLLQSSCNNLFVCYDADETGLTGMQNLIKSFPEIIQLQLPKNENIKGYDIADYFQEHTAQDFQKIIDLAVKNKSVVEVTTEKNENTDLTIFHKTENYLLKNYDIRFDIIANEFEMSKKDMKVWGELNDSSLYVEMQKKHLKISQGNLTAILSGDFVPKFNPLKEYFEGLHLWDSKTDYIRQFLNYIELEVGEDKEQFIYHFKKWCVRSVKCSIIEGYFNKQAFVLSDDAKGQSIGKTTFIRYLVPRALNKYYCENLPDDKDALKRLGQNFIINLDELATLSRTDINKLKSMFSSDKIKTRLPYGKKDIVISRVANFIGSTNMSTFLVDESGSVRWLCFIVKKINFKYSTEFNIDNLWSQAFALSKDESFNETMTVDDIKKNEIRNDKFQILSPERELIPKYFDVPTDNNNVEHLTSTSILNHISLWSSGIRLNNGAIGKAMPKCGFNRVKNKGIYGYWVIKKPTS